MKQSNLKYMHSVQKKNEKLVKPTYGLVMMLTAFVCVRVSDVTPEILYWIDCVLMNRRG